MELKFLENDHLQQHVICHMSHVKCYVSCVICYMTHFFFLTKWWSLFVEGLISTGRRLVFFFLLFSTERFHIFLLWGGGGGFRVSELPSFQVSKFPSFQGREGGKEGGPMRGLELIMGSQDQWEALKKNAPDGANRQTSCRQTDMATLWLKTKLKEVASKKLIRRYRYIKKMKQWKYSFW